jgi:hypothetical protein
MKLKYCFILLALIAGVLCLPTSRAVAQGDTLDVAWETSPGSGIPLHNALLDAITNDTQRPAGRVYRLVKGGYYQEEETITNSGFPLRIVGEPAGPTDVENPPVLQMVRRADLTVNQRMITGQDDIELRNLWITGADDNAVQTAYQPIQIDASNHTFIIDNCIFDRSNFAIIAFTATGNKIFYTNNKFRNLIGRPSTQQWEGRGISIWADQDTVVVENNTFFNVEFTAFQMETGAIKYLRFNHNTMVNIGRNFLTGSWWREAYFTNNLIVNGFWQGEGAADYLASGRDPRAYNSGMFGVGALPSKYGPDKGRRIVFSNTATWRDPQFAPGALYGDTIRAQWYVNAVTKEDFLDKMVGSDPLIPQQYISDTTWLSARPNFPTETSTALDTLVPKMWANIIDLRRGVSGATEYFYNLPTDFSGQECPVCVTWPLTEDFSYSTPASLLTAGTDGLPLGDLNWFPTAKATFEANKDNFVKDIEDLPGGRLTLTPVYTAQAEFGTIGGTSARDTTKGFTYFQMDGGGYIVWTLHAPSSGQYDLGVWTHMRGNSIRGEHTYVNGTEIHDSNHGYGELIYDTDAGITQGMPINDWTWVIWHQDDLKEAGALTLPAGDVTVKIAASWGYQNFAGLRLYNPGDTNTVVDEVLATDVTDYDVVAPKSNYKFTPEYFKSVLLNGNGTIAWTIPGSSIPANASYDVYVFYQNVGSDAAATLQFDGEAAFPVTLTSQPDSTRTSVLSASTALAAGVDRTLTLSGGGANIDFIQLIREQIGAAPFGGQGLPEGFALQQNYPNPFNPSTRIDFSLGKATNVKLTVYNILGQKVSTLVDNRMDAGLHTVTFDGKILASGVYFYRLEAGNFVSSKKMLLLK